MLSFERTPMCVVRRHLTLTDIFVIPNIHRLRGELSVAREENFRRTWQLLPAQRKTLAAAGFVPLHVARWACGMMAGQ